MGLALSWEANSDEKTGDPPTRFSGRVIAHAGELVSASSNAQNSRYRSHEDTRFTARIVAKEWTAGKQLNEEKTYRSESRMV